MVAYLYISVPAYGYGTLQALQGCEQAAPACIKTLENISRQSAAKLHASKHPAVQFRPGLERVFLRRRKYSQLTELSLPFPFN